MLNDFLLARIEAIQNELDHLKRLVNEESTNSSDIKSLYGIWKGLVAEEKDFQEAKRSVFIELQRGRNDLVS